MNGKKQVVVSRKRILVAVSLAHAAGLPKLSGILSHIGQKSDWELRLWRSENEMTVAALRAELERGLDGALLSVPYSPEFYEEVAKLKCPVVVMEHDAPELREKKENLVIIRNNSSEIVKAAAEHAEGAGTFKCYTFVHSRKPTEWSDSRAKAFLARFPEARIYESRGASAAEERKNLTDFIAELPIPAYILAANDKRAEDVLDAARSAKRKVPGEISVLGIDNDPFICSCTDPTLSSIEPDFFNEGAESAKNLDRMISARRPQPAKLVTIGVKRLVLRGSTSFLPPAEGVIVRAKDYIAAHALEGITPTDVASGIGVSRTLLDLRFRERKEKTVGEQLTDVRLAEVCRLLTKTSTPLKHIPELAGFKNANSLRNLFHRRYGVSLRTYRIKGPQKPA